MNTPQPQIKSPQDSDTIITAHDLFLALEEKKNDFKLDRWSIISEIINARTQIELFESGTYGKILIMVETTLLTQSRRRHHNPCSGFQ